MSLDLYPHSLGYLAGTVKKETKWDVMAYNADFVPLHGLESEKPWKYSYLASEGHNNYIKNLSDLSGKVWSEVRSVISDFNPAVVGITTKSQTLKSAHIIAKIAKNNNNETIVIMGGPHPSMVDMDLLNNPEIDVSVRGEGERTIVELLHAIENNTGFDGIQGIVFRNGRQIVENPPREFISDLDTLCYPHEYAHLLLKDYNLYPRAAFRNIFATRGCNFNCTFCGSRKIWSRKVRFRSPMDVVEQIKSLQEKGYKSIRFDDDTFGVNRNYIKELCNAIMKYCPNLKWDCEIHASLVDDNTISIMKAAGCYMIQLGVESGNNEILEKMRKNTTIEKSLAACQVIRKHGLELHALFLIGFPYETEESLNDTFEAMKKTRATQIVHNVFKPFPGTEIYEYCKNEGLVDDDFDPGLHHFQSTKATFCKNIPPERFRFLAEKIEKYVDRHNFIGRRKKIFSMNTLWKIKDLGMAESFKKALQIIHFK